MTDGKKRPSGLLAVNLIYMFGKGCKQPTDEEVIWSRCNVDLWGPKTIKSGGKTYKMHLMTMIDPVSSWFECAAVSGDPDSDKISKIFDDVWLARYPRPSHVGCNRSCRRPELFLSGGILWLGPCWAQNR